MRQKIILGLVGKIAAGKGTVATYLEKKYSASTYRFSDIMKDLLIRLHLPVNRHNLQTISTIIRQNFGQDIFAKIIAENVIKDNNQVIIVDGIRRMADIKYLVKNKKFKLVKVEASSEIRFKRLINRNEKQDDINKTYQKFLADQEQEADAEIPQVMKKATIEINNNGALAKLYNQIDKIIEQY